MHSFKNIHCIRFAKIKMSRIFFYSAYNDGYDQNPLVYSQKPNGCIAQLKPNLFLSLQINNLLCQWTLSLSFVLSGLLICDPVCTFLEYLLLDITFISSAFTGEESFNFYGLYQFLRFKDLKLLKFNYFKERNTF